MGKPRLAALLLALAAGGAGADTALRWFVQQAPPQFSYVQDRVPSHPQELADGESSGFLRLLTEQLPNYRHQFFDASLPRYEAMLKSGETLCSVLHKRTSERLRDRYFTPLFPWQTSHQLHLVLHRDTLPQLAGMSRPVSMAALLARRDLSGLLMRDRSYDAAIDRLLLEAGAAAPPRMVAGRAGNLLSMLRAKRMDYTLEFRASLDKYVNNEADADLVALPLAEVGGAPLSYASCSRNPAGRQRIEAIDEAVRRLARAPQREAWIRRWRHETLDPQDRQRLLRYLDERARSGPQIE